MLPLDVFSFAGINISDRHDILVNSIGAFPQENEAYVQIQWMIGLSYSLLLLLTLGQIVTYYLYNGRFHPFALIVMPAQGKVSISNCFEYANVFGYSSIIIILFFKSSRKIIKKQGGKRYDNY